MGHQVQESQIAAYRRRKQREAPGTQIRSLYEQNNELRQNYTVSLRDGLTFQVGDTLHAVVRKKGDAMRFIVTDCAGRTVGVIASESGRVLAELLRANRLSVVTVKVTTVIPVSGDVQVRIEPE